MPRTLQEILDHADELADEAERYEPDEGDIRDATALRALSQTVLALAQLNRVLADQVAAARHDGHSWAAIAAMLGTSGEAARQRYSAYSIDAHTTVALDPGTTMVQLASSGVMDAVKGRARTDI